eukprot:8393208-Alexandrium_andersonii.AAC.1
MKCTAAPGPNTPATRRATCGPPCATTSGSATTSRRRAGTTIRTLPRTGPTTARGAWVGSPPTKPGP